MSSQTHVTRPNSYGTYYFRMRVPKELVEEVGSKEIKKSLRTKDRQEAHSKASLERMAAEQLFEAARRSITYDKASPTHITKEALTQIV